MLTLAEAREWWRLSEEDFSLRLAACAEGKLADAATARASRCFGHDRLRSLVNSGRQAVMTVGIQKGGVGKTVVALNLAVALSQAGVRVLLIDCDPQASATNFLLPEDQDYGALLTTLEVCCEDSVTFASARTATRYPGLDLVASKPSVRKADAFLRSGGPVHLLRDKLRNAPYECVLFDVPPGFGELVQGAYLLSSRVLMPVLPDIWSIESASLTRADILEAAEALGIAPPRISLLLNRFRAGRIASADALGVLRDADFGEILPTALPDSAQIQNCVNDGFSVLEGNAPLFRKAFLDLSSQLWHWGDRHA